MTSKFDWTRRSQKDIARLTKFRLKQAKSMKLAVATLKALTHETEKLLKDMPQIGVPQGEFLPREVRKIFIADYEIWYELKGSRIIVLKIYHTLEYR